MIIIVRHRKEAGFIGISYVSVLTGHDLRAVGIHKAPLLVKGFHRSHTAGEVHDFGVLAGHDLLACVVYKAVPGPAGLAALNSKTAVASVAGSFVIVDSCGHIARFIKDVVGDGTTTFANCRSKTVAEVIGVPIITGNDQHTGLVHKAILIAVLFHLCHSVNKTIYRGIAVADDLPGPVDKYLAGAWSLCCYNLRGNDLRIAGRKTVILGQQILTCLVNDRPALA